MSKSANGRETNIEQLWCDLDDANARIKELTKKGEDCTIVLEPHQTALVLNGDGSISAAYMPKTDDDNIATKGELMMALFATLAHPASEDMLNELITDMMEG
jgi:hypothetical protein